MRLRPATLSDLPLLARLNRLLVEDERHRNRTQPDAWFEERMRGFLGGEYRAVLFEVEGQVIGYALFRDHPDPSDTVVLRQLYVDRAHRRQGLGREAIHLLREEVLGRDKRLTVKVLARNAAARAFYRALGFREYSIELEQASSTSSSTSHCPARVREEISVINELDQIIRSSLERFVRDISAGHWTGRREGEAISLYVLGYLQHEVRPDGPISDATQIAIEVPVQQINEGVMKELSGRTYSKAKVAKDVVIWPRPGMTCWTEHGTSDEPPLAIMEWKFAKNPRTEYDTRWIEEYSRQHAGFVGYSVALTRTPHGFELVATRVQQGARQERWLVLGSLPTP